MVTEKHFLKNNSVFYFLFCSFKNLRIKTFLNKFLIGNYSQGLFMNLDFVMGLKRCGGDEDYDKFYKLIFLTFFSVR